MDNPYSTNEFDSKKFDLNFKFDRSANIMSLLGSSSPSYSSEKVNLSVII